MEELKNQVYAPFLRQNDTTQRIMLFYIIAMLPTTVYGIIHFGIASCIVVAVAILSCEITEVVYHLVKKEEQTWKDFSAIATGLMFGLILPSNLEWWKVALAGIIGMLLGRLLFGGLGRGYIHPAIVAKCVLLLFFFKEMNRFMINDVVTKTPLAALKSGEVVNTMNMLIGNVAGNIGDVSVLCILFGVIFLILVGVLDLSVAGPAVIALGVMTVAFGGNGFDWSYIVAQLCGGGFMFVLFFIASDGVTSPITISGKWIFGALIGILTGVFRLLGIVDVSIIFALVIANILTPFIENHTIPKAFANRRDIKKA